MAVVPVGAGLAQGEAVQPRLARGDAVEAHAWHPVHVGRQQDAVPVHRSRCGRQVVAHAQGDGVALAPAQQRRGQAAVDGDGRARPAGDVHFAGADGQVERGAGEHLRGGRTCGARGRAQQAAAAGQAGEGQALDEAAAGQRRQGDGGKVSGRAGHGGSSRRRAIGRGVYRRTCAPSGARLRHPLSRSGGAGVVRLADRCARHGRDAARHGLPRRRFRRWPRASGHWPPGGGRRRRRRSPARRRHAPGSIPSPKSQPRRRPERHRVDAQWRAPCACCPAGHGTRPMPHPWRLPPRRRPRAPASTRAPAHLAAEPG